MIFLVSHAVRILLVALMLCTASTITPQDGPTHNIRNMSPEEELIEAYCSCSDINVVIKALSKNPNPFSSEVFTQARIARFLPSYILCAARSTLQHYTDQYLSKHIHELAQSCTIHDLLCYTPLSIDLIEIITHYTDLYRLPSNVIQYLSTKIRKNIPIQEENVSSILPYCIDDTGRTLFYYADSFMTEDAWRIFTKYRNTARGPKAIRLHVDNLLQDPLLCASSAEQKIFFATIEDVLSQSPSYSINVSIGQNEHAAGTVDHFEGSDQYKLIQDYVKAVPSLLTIHNENHNVFDCVDGFCHADRFHASYINKVQSLIRMFLKHKADPNMQNSKGDTFLHKMARKIYCCSSDSCPTHSPFIQQCEPYLNLTIKNTAGETVFDILREKIRNYDEIKDYCKEYNFLQLGYDTTSATTHKFYRQFLQTLITIQASLQIPKQPTISKPSREKIVTLR